MVLSFGFILLELVPCFERPLPEYGRVPVAFPSSESSYPQSQSVSISLLIFQRQGKGGRGTGSDTDYLCWQGRSCRYRRRETRILLSFFLSLPTYLLSFPSTDPPDRAVSAGAEREERGGKKARVYLFDTMIRALALCSRATFLDFSSFPRLSS